MLNPSNIYSEAKKRLEELTTAMRETEKSLAHVPDGKIHILTSKNRVQFYLRRDTRDKTGTYISKKRKPLIKALLQKSYDEKCLKLLKKEASSIQSFLKKSGALSHDIRELYDCYPPEAKKYINPVDCSDEDYVAAWLAEPYQGKDFISNDTCYITAKGERVRSKSELTIANALAQYGIPYKYEHPLKLKNGITVYPDFTILKIKQREEIYLEHLGMMDDISYMRNAIIKLKTYNKNGIMLGKQLMITLEGSNAPLGTDEIKNIIKVIQ
ncbi:MAG: hypothetical protein K6A30_06705 [Lachnospiraceae bacterium]|nr:hypothetical protein [Lachnospiraceae bacterium]